MWLWHGSLGSEFSKLKFELESQDPSVLRNKEVGRWTGPASSKTKVGGDSWWLLRNNCQSSRPQWCSLPVTASVGGGLGNRWRVLDGRTRVRYWPMLSLDRGWRPSSFLLRLCALSFFSSFLVVLGLCCCTWAFSRCGEQEWGLIVMAALAVEDRQALGVQASVAARRLRTCGSQATQRGLSSWGAPA